MNLIRIIGETMLAIVLAVAAAGKLRSPSSRAEVATLARLVQIPQQWAGIAPSALIAAEITVAALLVYPPTSGWGAVATALLMAVLTVGAERARRAPEPAACRCFGSAAEPIGLRHVVRNGALTAIAVLTAVLTFVPVGAALTTNGMVAAVLSGALLATVVVQLDTLLFLCGLRPTGPQPSQG
jgi:Methylamine utilisation protein MauE